MDGYSRKGAEKIKFWSMSLVALTVISGLTTMCLQMTVTALPLYIVELGVDSSYAGVATTVCTLAALLFRPLAARVIEAVRERCAAAMGAVIYLLVFAVCLLTSSLPLILVFRALQGIGMSLLTTSLGAAATAVIPKEQMTRGMSYFSLGNAVALCVGPALGLALAEQISYAAVFVVGAAFSLVTILGLVFLVKQTDRPVREGHTGEKGGFLKKALRSGAVFPSGLLALMILSQSTLTTFLAFYAQERGIGGASVFFSLNVLGMIFSKFFLGVLSERLGKNRLAILSSLLLAAAFVLVAAAAGDCFLWLAGVFYGFGYGGYYTLLNVEAVRHADAETRGAANSVFFGAKDMGNALGSLFGGLLAARTGYGALYIAGAVLSLVSGVLFTRYKHKESLPAEKAVDACGTGMR